MLKRLDHVSIGVRDMEKASNLFCDILDGEPLPDKGESPSEGFDWITFRLGGKKVELVTPHVEGEGGVGKYLPNMARGSTTCPVLLTTSMRRENILSRKGCESSGSAPTASPSNISTCILKTRLVR